MSLIIIRALLYCLVPLGIYLLVRGIKLILKYANAALLLDTPLQQSAAFTVLKEGDYAIWQAGKNIQNVPAKMNPPVIANMNTGERVTVEYSLSRVHVNNGSTGRIRLFTFQAKEGHYKFESGNNVTSSEPLLSMLMPRRNVSDTSSYSLQIREDKPGFLLIGGILLLILGMAILITGIVLPPNADKIFS